MPQLSSSVDSAVSFDDEDPQANSARDSVWPRVERQDSFTRLRAQLSSDDLEKMVVDIMKSSPEELVSAKMNLHHSTQEPSAAHAAVEESHPEPAEDVSSPVLVSDEKPAELPTPALDRTGSETTQSTCKSTDGGSPVSQQASSIDTFPSQPQATALPARQLNAGPTSAAPQEASEVPTTAAPKLVLPKKQAMFEVGGSSGESLTDQSPSSNNRKPVAPTKKKVFVVGGSSEEDSSPKHLKSALHTARQNSLLGVQKQASFSNKITTRTIPTVQPSTASESETEGDVVDESAIDDEDDSSEWEDSVEDSGKSSIDEKFFKRIDSSANLTSRRSLITLALEQSERARKLGNAASQSSPALQRSHPSQNAGAAGSPNDSDDSPLMMKRGSRPPLKPITEVSRTAAQPIITTNHGAVVAQGPLSPRSTRRNMLATELTASLRRHLVWERQQKTSTLNAVLKRRHTSHDVQNLKQYPEQPYIDRSEDVNASSWNADLSKDIGGYHSKGW